MRGGDVVGLCDGGIRSLGRCGIYYVGQSAALLARARGSTKVKE